MQFKTLAFQTLFVSAFAAPAPVLNNPDVDALNEVDAAVASLPINTKRQILNNANVDALNEVDAAVASLPINTKRQILNNPDVDALNTVDATVVSLSGKDGEDSLLNLKRADAGSITDVLDNLLATISPLVGEVLDLVSSLTGGLTRRDDADIIATIEDLLTSIIADLEGASNGGLPSAQGDDVAGALQSVLNIVNELVAGLQDVPGGADLNNLVVELSTTASNLIETLTGIVNGLLGQLNLGSLQSLNLGGLLGGASN